MVLGRNVALAAPEKRAFARGVSAVYAARWNETLPWRERRPSACYRGACNPTINPLRLHGGPPTIRGCGTLELRAAACGALRDAGAADATVAGLVDFGLTAGNMQAAGGCDGAAPPASCAACERCAADPLSRQAQTRHKVLLNVDGYGMASDASFWKLASGSAVVWLVREGTDEPVHGTWYSPLLRPWVHYIPASPRDVTARVRWCLEDDGRCEAIARRARELVARAVSRRAMDAYAAAVLRGVHDAFAPPG